MRRNLSSQMSENRSLIKSTRIVALGTLASRILGFVRDIIIAKFFGTGAGAQAFVVAFRIPNLLRRLVGEGATSAAVVPVLSRLKTLGKEDEFWQATNCLLNILVVLLAGLVLLGELFAPYIVRAIAPGFIKDPTKLYLTIRLSRFLFPYLLLIGLSAYAMAVLNSLKHFALPALGPCMLNISLIASSLIFCPRLEEPVYGLAIGVLIGGLLQLAIQVPLLMRKGLLRSLCPSLRSRTKDDSERSEQPRPFAMTDWVHPKVKEMGRLFLPSTLGIAVYQINVFVDTILASLAWIVGEGAVAALYYSYRIVQFPLALFGLALAQVAIPTMSGLVARDNLVELKKTVTFSLRSVFTLMIPATVGIMVLARPLVNILFERGSFTSYSTSITSSALLFYCLGLTGYAGIKILASCFYALKDTLTPAKIAALALLVNIVLNLILMWPLKVAGLALATAISATVNFILLLSVLRKRIGKIDGLLPTLGRVILAATLMGLALWFISANLFISILAGIAVYLGALKVFAQEEAEIFIGWILKRK